MKHLHFFTKIFPLLIYFHLIAHTKFYDYLSPIYGPVSNLMGSRYDVRILAAAKLTNQFLSLAQFPPFVPFISFRPSWTESSFQVTTE